MKYLRSYNESYQQPNSEAFIKLVDDIQKEIEDIFTKIRYLVNQGYHLNNGDRVFHKKGSDRENGFYGTVVRTGSGRQDWYIDWDDPEAAKWAGKTPSVKYTADWEGGFNFLKAELKPQYDKLLIELKKFQDAKGKIYPDNQKLRCIESTSKYFQSNTYYIIGKNYDGFFVRIKVSGLAQYDWERIRATEDGYTWVWKDNEDHYAVFENEDVKDFMITFNKLNIQRRFDL